MEPEGPSATSVAVRSAVRDAFDVARERALDLVLVLLGARIPRLLRRLLFSLRAAGWAFLALGAFAVLRPAEFLAALPYLMGASFVALAALLLWTANQIAAATSLVRLGEQAILAFRERAPKKE